MPEDDETQQVVIDREGRHALWPHGRPCPAGWSATGFTGGREACMAYVDAIWPDQRRSPSRETRDGRR